MVSVVDLTKILIQSNPFFRVFSYAIPSEDTSTSILGKVLHISAETLQLVLAFSILIGLILIRAVLAGVISSISIYSRKPSGTLTAVMVRLIAEDLARIAHLIGQELGASAITLFGYVLLFLGLRGVSR